MIQYIFQKITIILKLVFVLIFFQFHFLFRFIVVVVLIISDNKIFLESSYTLKTRFVLSTFSGAPIFLTAVNTTRTSRRLNLLLSNIIIVILWNVNERKLFIEAISLIPFTIDVPKKL